MTRFSRFGKSFAEVNARMQGNFLRSMAVARGFAADPLSVTKPLRQWRANRKQEKIERRKRASERMKTRMSIKGKSDWERKTISEVWEETKIGTEIVWQPVLVPLRKHVIFPLRRGWARFYDGVAGAKRSLFGTWKPRTPTAKPNTTAGPQGHATPDSNSFAVVLRESRDTVIANASSASRHFRELMLDPNFKRRQMLHKLRKWEPSTHAGRVMAPMALLICFMMPVWGVTFLIAQREVVEMQARTHKAKKDLQLRSDPTESLGLSTDMSREKYERTEDDALLNIFMTKKW
eukprot:TRINITY_DN7340_c0_g3_i1.p1 TRINITY_DN7340_c0_g3~~TRINITY_DN7340_c0_g3_i1.p1  ORF type:complete len:291 (+),score=76.44 TRINITY_DN7340_c0_g3_i1:73-945(+)